MTPRYLVEGLVRRYRESRTGRSLEALRVPRLEVHAGEILGVVGANGSGKSTLLETMAFLCRPEEGRVLLDDRDVWAEGEALAARRRCPMLLQRTVLFRATVVQNVMYGLRLRGVGRSEERRRAEAVLRQVGLEGLAQRARRELSGGERQRVALARLLALEPETLLLDEPTAHVDAENEGLIEDVIRELRGRTRMTVVLATHSLRQAMGLADRVVTLVAGRLLPGTLDNLFRGTLRREGDGFVFQGEGGLDLRLATEAVAWTEGGMAPASGATVFVAIDAERVEVASGEEATGVRGQVESVRWKGEQCHLQVRLGAGQHMQAAVPLADYQRLGLNVGSAVRIRLGAGAVRVIAR